MNKHLADARINQYENGKRIPNFLILKKIAKVLLVPVAYFYTEDDMAAQFLFLYEKINKQIRKQVLQYFRIISKHKDRLAESTTKSTNTDTVQKY